MAFDRFLIGPVSIGLQTDLKPFMIPDEAFTQLNNAYVFRGRVRKRFGSRLMGADQRSSRFRVALQGGAAIGITDGAGAAAGTVPGALFQVGQMFSIGTALYTVNNPNAGAQPMLQTVPTTTATFNITNGAYVFNGAPALTQIYFYPAQPVMGLTLYEKGPITTHVAYGFDPQFAYAFSGTAWERSITGANPVWHGDDADFFWATNWEGITSKMYNPVSHLDDCNLKHYNLQLSLYAYIIKKHNPKLKIGKLQIQHVSFEKEGENEYGYPITKYNDQEEPIIKEIKMYELPYLKDEITSLIMWLKDNPQC